MNFITAFAHPHAPNLALLRGVPPVIVVHLILALLAFAIGLFQVLGARLFGQGGKTLHRVLGWIWVVMMMTVAVSSFFIHVINPAGYSLIHLLSVFTVCVLPVAIYAARTHRAALHARMMTNTFLGALVVAGVFTLFPGRLMYQMFFG